METARQCRQHALQCFRWAVEHDDPAQQHVFVEIARSWLEAARVVERDPVLAAVTIRRRLH